jgi:glycine/D-amino acid oxidase-like deaminating enzyme
VSHPPIADVIVAGLGAAGSAAAYHLARRGARVVGVDRYTPPHAMGSSHGRSRIIREAYFEHPLYVPLVREAYMGWEELEALTGRRLYLRTGGLMLGPADGTVVPGARRSALEHGLSFEELAAEDVRRRFPAWHLPDDVVGIFEPRAGMLDPEAAIAAHLDLARRHGAELRFDEPLLSWRAEGDAVEVTTSRATYRAARLVLAVGAWTPRVLAPLGLPLVVERNVVAWFDTTAGQAVWPTGSAERSASLGNGGSTGRNGGAGRGAPAGRNASSAADVAADPEAQSRPAVGVAAGAEARSRPAVGIVARAEARSESPPGRAEDLFAPERFPVFVHEVRPGLTWYGFPDTGDGVKAGIHHSGEATDPETERREATERDVARIRELVGAYLPTLIGAHLPAAARPIREAAVCLYTNAPDDHFLLGPHPDHPAVIVVSACSGHGFKFAPVIGELAAELALEGRSRHDLTPFRIERLLG